MSGFDSKVIGEAIYQYRVPRHMTQAEFAAKVGAAPDTISKYESGSMSPNASRLWDLAKAMDTTPNDLLGWPGDSK